MSSPERVPGGAAAGFTLLEVLVAFTIAAIGLAALLQGGTAALGNAGIAAASIEATRRAQSRLAAVGAVGSLLPGETAGEDGDGYHWRIRVSPILVRGADPAARAPGEARRAPSAFLVEATVGWKTGRRTRDVTLTTMRLANPAAPASDE